ncbi:hypothetical protein [Nostoc sp.]
MQDIFFNIIILKIMQLVNQKEVQNTNYQAKTVTDILAYAEIEHSVHKIKHPKQGLNQTQPKNIIREK